MDTIETCNARTATIDPVPDDELADLLDRDATGTVAVTIDNGCSHAYVVAGTRNDLVRFGERIARLAQTMPWPEPWITGNTYNDGYCAARRFYGERPRECLTEIKAVMAAFRAAFPEVPYQVDLHLSQIDAILSNS